MVFVALALLTPQAVGSTAIAYSFHNAKTLQISTLMTFSGDIPILGGQKGDATASLEFHVHKLADTGKKLKFSEELTQFHVEFNQTVLPISVQDAVKYFPKTSFEFDSGGTYRALSSPPKKVPVQLPGLSLVNVPRISFLPLQLPVGLGPKGSTGVYSEKVNGGVARFRLIIGDSAPMGTAINFTYSFERTGLEDAAEMLTTNRKDAVSKVAMTDHGKGLAVFSPSWGAIINVQMSDKAQYKVVNLSSHKTTYRHLVRKVFINVTPQS